MAWSALAASCLPRPLEPRVMWSHLPVEALIEQATRGNYGLAPKKWTQQLEQIRNLPEAKKP